MSKVNKKSLNKYLDSIKIDDKETCIFEYATNGTDAFKVEVKQTLGLEDTSGFITTIANAVVSNGEYHPEFWDYIIEIAFLKYFVINIDMPTKKVDDVEIIDSDKASNIVRKLCLIERFKKETEQGSSELSRLLDLATEKIRFEYDENQSKIIATELMTNLSIIVSSFIDTFDKALDSIDDEQLEMLVDGLKEDTSE